MNQYPDPQNPNSQNSNLQSKNALAITMGDPCGIGPEICAALFHNPNTPIHAFVIGDATRLRLAVKILNIPLEVHEIASVTDAQFKPGTLEVLQVGTLPEDLPFSQVRAEAGRAAYDYVVRGIELARAGSIAGIVTAPLNKEAMNKAGIHYPGHTEILADFAGTSDYAMMLVSKRLRSILVSIHVPMRQALEAVTFENELRIIRLAHRTLIEMGLQAPRLAVAGLNPHASENGMFGSEDLEIIAPAVQAARNEGIDVQGPFPGDTVFTRALKGDFDLVVAQYHDQGLIPIKLLDFDNGVNITVGLDFIRTSVDHGTAFDIAGKGTADPSSLRSALELAHQLVQNKTRNLSTRNLNASDDRNPQ